MPIYEYECANCGHRLEVIQKISDGPLTECPQCQAQQLRKLVSAAAFQLKGSGWYVTDFRDKPGAKKDSKDTAEGSEKKPAADSKPAAAGDQGGNKTDKPAADKQGSKPAASTATGKGD